MFRSLRLHRSLAAAYAANYLMHTVGHPGDHLALSVILALVGLQNWPNGEKNGPYKLYLYLQFHPIIFKIHFLIEAG